MALPNYVGLDYGDAYKVSSSRVGNLQLGQIGMTPDGNMWRYCKASSVQLAAGLFCVGESVPVHEDTVTVAHAIGTEVVTVTAAGVSKDDYRDGYLVVTDGPGAGEMHRIKSNTATSGGTIQVTFHPGDGLTVAWTTAATDVDIFTALHGALIVAPTDGQQLVVCIPQRIIPASNFFWGLVHGYGAFQCENASAAGLELDEKRIHQSLTVAGQGLLPTSPNEAEIIAQYRQLLGYLLTEEDTVTTEMELALFTLI